LLLLPTTLTHPLGDFRLAEYRAYTVGDDGHFIGFEPIICADDAEATKRAKRLVDGHDIELWCGERFVTTFAHKPEYGQQLIAPQVEYPRDCHTRVSRTIQNVVVRSLTHEEVRHHLS
jgi:hypothetical protein